MQLTQMKNIGKEMERKLMVIGINSAEELREAGSKAAFLRFKCAYPEACLVHLYVLEGAIEDTLFNRLSESVKKDLKEFYDQLK